MLMYTTASETLSLQYLKFKGKIAGNGGPPLLP